MYLEGPTDFGHVSPHGDPTEVIITIGQVRYPKLKSKQSLYLAGLKANMHRHRGKYFIQMLMHPEK